MDVQTSLQQMNRVHHDSDKLDFLQSHFPESGEWCQGKEFTIIRGVFECSLVYGRFRKGRRARQSHSLTHKTNIVHFGRIKEACNRRSAFPAMSSDRRKGKETADAEAALTSTHVII